MPWVSFVLYGISLDELIWTRGRSLDQQNWPGGPSINLCISERFGRQETICLRRKTIWFSCDWKKCNFWKSLVMTSMTSTSSNFATEDKPLQNGINLIRSFNVIHVQARARVISVIHPKECSWHIPAFTHHFMFWHCLKAISWLCCLVYGGLVLLTAQSDIHKNLNKHFETE